MHLPNWGRCDTHLNASPTIRYIEDTYEAATDAMRSYDAVRFDLIQHNAIWCIILKKYYANYAQGKTKRLKCI